jgi:DMATS type aromatic prenyltransferase
MAASISMNLPVSDQSNHKGEVLSNQKDQIFWSGALSQSLVTLLQTSKYINEEQLYYLHWFERWILPAMGPQPIDGKPYYTSSFTHDGSPLEYSLNWKEKKTGQTIRFTIEPSSPKTGTATDRLNQQAADDFLTRMKASKGVPGLDLTRFYLFLSETNVPDEAVDEVLLKNPPGRPLTRVLVAFDMEPGSSVVAKAYFLPHLKAIYTGIPVKTIVFDAIRKCNGPFGSYNASIAALDSFLETFDVREAGAPQVFMLSNDCVVDSPGSRVKVYVDASVGNLAQAKNVFHLGGRISGPAMATGLKAVGDFWCHVFGLDSSDPDVHNKEVLSADGAKCVFVFEMRPAGGSQAQPEMEVKMHMPASWLGKTDAEICQVLSTWFQKHGHGDLASRYQPDLAFAL